MWNPLRKIQPNERGRFLRRRKYLLGLINRSERDIGLQAIYKLSEKGKKAGRVPETAPGEKTSRNSGSIEPEWGIRDRIKTGTASKKERLGLGDKCRRKKKIARKHSSEKEDGAGKRKKRNRKSGIRKLISCP